MKQTSNAVRSRLAFWINQGVVIEKSADQFIAAQSYQSLIKGKFVFIIKTKQWQQLQHFSVSTVSVDFESF